jgi:hypothetical protein
MFRFFKKISWWFHYISWLFHYNKWILNIEHLVSLVEVLESMAFKIGQCVEITAFCSKAKAVIQHGEHISKKDLEDLKRLLQEISNHPTIRQFLGRREPRIGGKSGIGEAWTSAKMHAFLQSFASWKGAKITKFQFNESDSRMGITADDMRHHGHNTGPIFRVQIHQIWVNNGCFDTRQNALNEAKAVALQTPRGGRRNSLDSSSSSVQTPRPLNVSLSPVSTPRTEYKQTPRPRMTITPRPTFEQMDSNFLLSTFFSEDFLDYLRDCYQLSKMTRSGNLWVLYDLLNWYKNMYQNSLYINSALQRTFIDSMRSNKLVTDALTILLSDSLTDDSLLNLRHKPLSKQEEFFEVLRMIIRHELWKIQTQSLVKPGMFIYKCSKGAWVQNPETLGFSLFSLDALPTQQTQIVKAA